VLRVSKKSKKKGRGECEERTVRDEKMVGWGRGGKESVKVALIGIRLKKKEGGWNCALLQRMEKRAAGANVVVFSDLRNLRKFYSVVLEFPEVV